MKKEISGYIVNVLSKDSEKANNFMRAYNNVNNCGELHEVYGRYSTEKINAIYRCKHILDDFSGFCPRITGHNSSYFTYGFKTTIDGILHLVIITYLNIYAIPLY